MMVGRELTALYPNEPHTTGDESDFRYDLRIRDGQHIGTRDAAE